MKLIKSILHKIPALVLLITIASCNKWLDVKPKDQVRDTELFETETGFNEALSGVYATLTLEGVYGKQLTYGLLGVLASEWDYSSETEYRDARLYDYTAAMPVRQMDSIWSAMYFAINGANKIINAIDSRQSVFNGNNYRIVKGEALALRAFIHFDLLRLYGASFAENSAKMSIPYYTKSSEQIAPQLRVSEVADSILADFKAAEILLKDVDPIVTGVVNADEENSFLLNRKLHLNYYAVKGMMARLYLYKNDFENALTCANEVINSGKFPWVKQANLFSDTADVSFSSEHVFGLNMVNMNQTFLKYFNDARQQGVAFAVTFETATNDLFAGITSDYRYLYTLKSAFVNNANSMVLQKMRQSTSASWPEAYKNKVPMLKIAELYMIAAECLARTSITEAAEKVNAITKARGTNPFTITAANFRTAVTAEYRREFLGEGQLFHYYKRLNMTVIPKGSDNLVQLRAYKFPLPQAEYANANRVDNR